MKRPIVMVLCLWMLVALTLTGSLEAASLYWDAPANGTLTVELGAAATGPFTVIATIPATPQRYALTPARWGFYRIANASGVSNVVEYRADLEAPGVTDRLDILEMKVGVIEMALGGLTNPVPTPAPIPASNLTTWMIDADHVAIIGGNCRSLKTTGSGLKRVIECVH